MALFVCARQDAHTWGWKPPLTGPAGLGVPGKLLSGRQGCPSRVGIPTVVDLDIEKFFDRVNHDDKRVPRLILRYQQVGIIAGGRVEPAREGTPQGGPLSLLLSNILLDELDKELEKRSCGSS
jgi:retron-type reverse transcriptase